KPRVPSCLSGVHDLIADMRGPGGREVAAAFGDHGRGDVGQHEAAVGIAAYERPAEEAGAATKLEHPKLPELGQILREMIRHRALEPGVELVALRRFAEARRDGGATTGEHGRIQGHDARTILGALTEEHDRHRATRQRPSRPKLLRSSMPERWD